MDLSVLWDVTYGLYVVSSMDGERPVGCIANTCMQITSQNPIFAISLNKQNYTLERVQKTGRFAVSILSEQVSPKLIGDFGFSSSREKDKFEPYRYQMVDGLPVLSEGCASAMLFDVVSQTELETHVVVFGRLTNTLKVSKEHPMDYEYYHKVVKGKAPKTAPTYHEEPAAPAEKKPAGHWYCTVCGYVYEGDLNAEPDSYVCPICGVGKDKFEFQPGEEKPEAETWVCTVCGYVYEGDLNAQPDSFTCPICGVGKDKFELRSAGQKETEKKANRWYCTVCGYVYEGDLDAQPDTFTCPICGVGKDKFERN